MFLHWIFYVAGACVSGDIDVIKRIVLKRGLQNKKVSLCPHHNYN